MFLSSPLPWEMIQFEEHIFEMGSNCQPENGASLQFHLTPIQLKWLGVMDDFGYI